MNPERPPWLREFRAALKAQSREAIARTRALLSAEDLARADPEATSPRPAR